MGAKRMAGLEIKILSNLMRQYLQEQRPGKDLMGLTSTQAMILHHIYKTCGSGTIRQRDLENAFNVRRSTISSILQRMEKQSLIVRERSGNDARMKTLRLTEQAIAAYKSAHRAILGMEQRMIEGISKEELDTFFAVIDKMKQNIGIQPSASCKFVQQGDCYDQASSSKHRPI